MKAQCQITGTREAQGLVMLIILPDPPRRASQIRCHLTAHQARPIELPRAYESDRECPSRPVEWFFP